jgi:membrane protein implicated in regulation of membrane protease activity
MTATALTLVALVGTDPAVIRNAPRDDAPAQASVWRGDWLEVRGESAGFLRVYDHRHERPGYIRPTQVRVYRADAGSAGELAAIVRFLRDAPGSESLGIGYAALALKVTPAGIDTTELLASIGTMADRLAARLSARRADARDATLAGHREVVESYGMTFRVVDAETLEGKARICYDGEVWRHLVAVPTTGPVDRARAALAMAVDRCRNPLPSPADERAWNDRRISALQTVDFAVAAALPASLAGQVRLRRAEALAWRAFDEARRGNLEAAARAEAAAVRELALVDRGVLAPEDLEVYEDVAVRVAASRWATETPPKDSGRRSVSVVVAPGAPGESCVRVVDARGDVRGERCTFGIVWEAALRWSPSGTMAAIAVQPLPAWTELWVLRRDPDHGSWTFETLTPATTDPDAGYVEAAGFSPDGARLLVVREARVAGRVTRKFQVLAAPTLAVERWAASADKLGAFKRWSAPSWRAGTLALR